MKKLQHLLLVLILGFAWSGQRVEGQTLAQAMTFAVICQYATNTYYTNASGEIVQDKMATTAYIDSANIVKAIAVQDFPTNWPKYAASALYYQVNVVNGNQGIFMRGAWGQTNVTSYFTGTNVFPGECIGSFINTPEDWFTAFATNAFVGTNIAGTNIPVIGGLNYFASTKSSTPFASNNISEYTLAYLTFATSNTAFNLFGYSQGKLLTVLHTVGGTQYTNYLNEALISGAGTFSLNLGTNFLFRYSGETVTNGAIVSTVVTNVIAPQIYTGVAHGTVHFGAPIFLNVSYPEGP